jgi:hypothetical protein
MTAYAEHTKPLSIVQQFDNVPYQFFQHVIRENAVIGNRAVQDFSPEASVPNAAAQGIQRHKNIRAHLNHPGDIPVSADKQSRTNFRHLMAIAVSHFDRILR